MTEGQKAEFACNVCGKRFRWKAEMAGRTARCPCGNIMQCPQSPPEDKREDEIDYDLAPQISQAVPPAPRPKAPPVAQVAPLAYQTPKSLAPGPADVETIKNFHTPLVLLGGGIVIESLAALFELKLGPATALIHLGIQVVLGTALMLFGVLLVAYFRGIQLGSIRSAILRLSAVSVAPGAAADLLYPLLHFTVIGNILALILRFVLYFALLGVFFDLDESDTWACVWVIFFINLSVYALVRWAPWR